MKTKSVGGKEHPAKDFLYVGDANDTSTWHEPVFDEGHVRDAMARFGQTDFGAGADKPALARKLARIAKRMGMDASGFMKEHGMTKAANAAADDDSYEELRDEIDAAIRKKFPGGQNSYSPYIIATYPSYVIVRDSNGELAKIDYVVGLDDEVTLGDPQPVEVAYVPVQESVVEAAFLAEAGSDEWTFPVRAMKAGLANGFVALSNGKQMRQEYPPEVVAQVADALKNARFGRRHPNPGENETLDASRIAGYTTDGRMVGDEAHCNVHLAKNETELQAKLSAARAEKQLDKYGVSVLGYFAFKAAKVNGEEILRATKLAKLSSLDLCVEPAAGGVFMDSMRAAASTEVLAEISAMQAQAVKKQNSGGAHSSAEFGGAMKEQIIKALLALRAISADAAAPLEEQFKTLGEGKYGEFFVRVAEASVEAAKAAAKAITDKANQNDTTVAAVKAANDTLDQAKAILAEARQLASDNLVEKKLKDSKLPEPGQKIVRAHLAKRVVDEATIDAEIKLVREQLAAMSPVGRVAAGVVVGGMESGEKVQLALDALMGVKDAAVECAKQKIAKLRGIREAYVLLTGDEGLRFGADGIGGFTARSALATAVTSDFPNLLLNSMTKRLLQDYAENAVPGLESLVSFVDVNDFKTQDRIRVGYLSDIATVNEDAAYVDFTLPTDELATWTPTKRGNTLPISRETIINDDLGKITVFPSRMGRAARRTLNRFITAFFSANPAYTPDSVAWFHATHNNLGSTALAIAELILVEVALANQTEKDSDERLGLTLDWLMVPNELYASACSINQQQLYVVGAETVPSHPNPFYHRFGMNNERIIKNYLLTDTNDWYAGSDQAKAPFLEVGFVLGVREPQMFLQNDPNVGAVFTNDRITYKIRHEYGGGITDFRPVYKEAVA